MTTDDDVRQELRAAAVEAARVLRKGLDGTLLDSVDRDSKAHHAMVHTAEMTITAWAKSLPQGETPAPPGAIVPATDPERRAAMVVLLRENPKSLQELAVEAGVEIRRVGG